MCGTASFLAVYVLVFIHTTEKPSSWFQKTYLLQKSNRFSFACYFKPNVDVALCCFINKLLFSATCYWKWHRTCRLGTVPLWQMGRVWACQPTIPHITQQIRREVLLSRIATVAFSAWKAWSSGSALGLVHLTGWQKFKNSLGFKFCWVCTVLFLFVVLLKSSNGLSQNNSAMGTHFSQMNYLSMET